MLGYFRDPELTAAAFTEDGSFKTGDCVSFDAEGQMRIAGRIKEQFKTSKGKYVVPAPIETRLMEHPAVEAHRFRVTVPSPPPTSASQLHSVEVHA